MDIVLIILGCANIVVGIIDLMCDKVSLGIAMLLVGFSLLFIC